MNPEMDRVFWLADGVRRYGLVALIGLAAICLMSGNYAPLMESAAQRYLASKGKALWQLEQSASSARTALQQVVTEAELAVEFRLIEQQATADYMRKLEALRKYKADFDAVLSRYRQDLVYMEDGVSKIEKMLEEMVRKPGFYDDKTIGVGDLSTPAACRNPSVFYDESDNNLARVRDINVCVMYYASSDVAGRSNPVHRHTVALLLALTYPGGGTLDLPKIFAYYWYGKILEAANRGDPIPRLPALFSDGRLSNGILGDVDSGFVALASQNVTSAQLLLLRDTVHPDMMRLASLAQQMGTICREVGSSPCIPPVIRF